MKNESIAEKLRYREPMNVTEFKILGNCGCFPVCPRCNNIVEREYQAFCDNCGQRLAWKGYYKAKLRQ